MTSGRGDVKQQLGAARRRMGHHGAFLLALAALDAAYAAGMPTQQGATWVWLVHVAPLPVWMAMWAAAGLVLAVGAFCERDWFAFSTAILIKVAWASIQLIGIAHGAVHGWTGVAVWVWAAAVVAIIAVWPERSWPAA
jgi:hypothetical protein